VSAAHRYQFKVALCNKHCDHDWDTCPYAHIGEAGSAARDLLHHACQHRIWRLLGAWCAGQPQDSQLLAQLHIWIVLHLHLPE
jgi:hypothetical protein